MGGNAITYERPFVEVLGGVEVFFDRMLRPKLDVPADIDWRAKKIKGFIDTDPVQGRQNLDDVCKQLGLCVSSRQARRLFKVSTGVGIRDYARNRRLVVAIERLEVMGVPVKVIAAELGYRSARQFRRHFKDFFGLSPLEFRRLSGNTESNVVLTESP
jgi:methylphosphotriester-DNA--protein-cysteine methyltransferase